MAIASLRYAKALFEIALEEQKVDEFAAKIGTFTSVYNSDKDFSSLINHPQVNAEEKLSLIKKAFGGELPEEVYSFFALVLRKGRESEIGHIFSAFNGLVLQYKNIAEAVVTSAVPLSDSQVAKLQKTLSQKLNKEVIIKQQVDKDVIAGVKIAVAGMLYDATVGAEVHDMKKQLLERPLA